MPVSSSRQEKGHVYARHMGQSTLEGCHEKVPCLVDFAEVEIWGFGKEEHYVGLPMSRSRDCRRSTVRMAC